MHKVVGGWGRGGLSRQFGQTVSFDGADECCCWMRETLDWVASTGESARGPCPSNLGPIPSLSSLIASHQRQAHGPRQSVEHLSLDPMQKGVVAIRRPRLDQQRPTLIASFPSPSPIPGSLCTTRTADSRASGIQYTAKGTRRGLIADVEVELVTPTSVQDEGGYVESEEEKSPRRPTICTSPSFRWLLSVGARRGPKDLLCPSPSSLLDIKTQGVSSHQETQGGRGGKKIEDKGSSPVSAEVRATRAVHDCRARGKGRRESK